MSDVEVTFHSDEDAIENKKTGDEKNLNIRVDPIDTRNRDVMDRREALRVIRFEKRNSVEERAYELKRKLKGDSSMDKLASKKLLLDEIDQMCSSFAEEIESKKTESEIVREYEECMSHLEEMEADAMHNAEVGVQHSRRERLDANLAKMGKALIEKIEGDPDFEGWSLKDAKIQEIRTVMIEQKRREEEMDAKFQEILRNKNQDMNAIVGQMQTFMRAMQEQRRQEDERRVQEERARREEEEKRREEEERKRQIEEERRRAEEKRQREEERRRLEEERRKEQEERWRKEMEQRRVEEERRKRDEKRKKKEKKRREAERRRYKREREEMQRTIQMLQMRMQMMMMNTQQSGSRGATPPPDAMAAGNQTLPPISMGTPPPLMVPSMFSVSSNESSGRHRHTGHKHQDSDSESEDGSSSSFSSSSSSSSTSSSLHHSASQEKRKAYYKEGQNQAYLYPTIESPANAFSVGMPMYPHDGAQYNPSETDRTYDT